MQNKDSDEINLLDYVAVLVRRRRMILRNTLLVAFATALISFFLPMTYTATTTLLPPDDAEPSGLRGLLANSPASFLDLPGLNASSSEIFVEILKSRTVANGVIERKYDFRDASLDLFQIWDVDSKSEASELLQERTSFSANEQGVVQISVEMRDPDLAAQVAQAFVAELDRVNQEKSLSRAKSSRRYIEEQLALTAANLKTASEALAKFQAKFKAVDLEEQTRVAIEKAGEIKGAIMAKEVQLAVTQQTLKADNPRILHLQKELEELRKQFEHLQFGNSIPFEEQRDYFIPFADVPEVGLKFADLFREVKVQETVWQLLNQQYYSAKIQEARDTPTVQVLDVATPPERRTRPKRTLLVAVASILTLFLCIFFAFGQEYAENFRNNKAEFERVQSFKTEIRRDYDEVRRKLSEVVTKLRNR